MNAPNASSPYPAAGEIVDGKYRIEKLLGEGGMGAVARATHVVLGGTVALKFMNPQFITFPGAVERFVNEGRASKAIKSDHVLPVNDVGLLANGTPYLLMECLYGLDLADLLMRDGPSGLPISRAVHFVLQILRGLQAAHAINIIHRDMKPSNCFVVTHDGEEDFVKILDFGISKVVQPGSSSLTQTNSALGTPLYMSPEQARSPRDVDARSDLYSVGVILYELLCGRTPFFSESGEFTEILFQLFTADPPPIQQARPDLPDELAAVVHTALAREPNDRYPTALAFGEALEPFASDRSLPLVDRLRGFKPPTNTSIVPGEGLPTSMAAFSQLQQRHATAGVANHRATDASPGLSGTEVMASAPHAPVRAATALLPQHLSPSGAPHVAALPAMRVRPDEALGRTQYEPDAQRHASGTPALGTTKVRTDLGASRDATASEQGTPIGRSPFVYALPLVVVVGFASVVGLAVAKRKSGERTTPIAEPSATLVVAAPSAVEAIPSAASSPSAVMSSSPPSDLPSATASSKPSTKPIPHPSSSASPQGAARHPGYIPGLDTQIQQ